jgi:hypothetical protein
MLVFLRAFAVMVALIVGLPASIAAEKEALSLLTSVTMKQASDDVVVTLVGSKAPDFTSFTMSDPFRVVVDWAGSKLHGVIEEKRFDRGVIRKISTRQFDSEAEKISRITIELSRETSYHVEADGKRVLVHFVPVPDPIPQKEPEPLHADEKAKPETVASAIPEGPLTEPDLPIPAAPPPMPKKEVIAEKPAPQPAQPPAPAPAKPAPVMVATNAPAPPAPSAADTKPKAAPAPQKVEVAEAKKTEPPKSAQPAPPVTVAKAEPKVEPKPAAAPPPKATEPKLAETKRETPPPATAPAKAETPKLAEKTRVDETTKIPGAKSEPAKIADASKPAPAKPAPVVAKTETPPVVAAAEKPKAQAAEAKPQLPPEPVRLATFPGVSPDRKPVAAQDKPAAKELALRAPPAAKIERAVSPPPARIANAASPRRTAQEESAWVPPSIPIKSGPPKSLPVLKLAQADGSKPLRPAATLPADPEEPAGSAPSGGGASSSSSGSSADPNDFDPGPRVMKYIGFRQMADVSRVFVRCDGKVKFREMKDGSSVVLELVDTSINVKNNGRPLDTTYFNSAVTKVQAVRAGSSTRIEVKLRESVPYKITRNGKELQIDFKRSG